MDRRSFTSFPRGYFKRYRPRRKILCFLVSILVASIILSGFHKAFNVPELMLPFTAKCGEKHDIVFLKVHKTGSSTIANILQRFGYFRNLNFALPNKRPDQLRYNYFGAVGETLSPEGIIPSKPNSEKYNILYNHVIFNWKAFLKIFPKKNAVYVTMLREPVKQFLSALLFFLHENILDAAMKNFTSYLEEPQVFEPEESPYLSFTNNRQALDLGLPPTKVRDKAFILKYIRMLDKVFDLVLITEYFDESLIILKRRLCWSFKDIIYIRKNIAYQSHDFKLSVYDRKLLKNWTLADHLIYAHFYNKFHKLLKQEPDIMEEAHHFKTVLDLTQGFCNGSSNATQLVIHKSAWNQQFRVTALDCAYMFLGELKFLNKILHDRKL